jgi:uncharacterized membrane protein
MSANQLRVVGSGLFFLFIFLSGFWLSRSGKPYSAIIFNIHKSIGLAALVFLVVTIYRINQVAALSAIELIAGVITVLLFLSTTISGGLVSIEKPMPAAISMMHKLFPYLTVLSTAVTLYLVLGRK